MPEPSSALLAMRALLSDGEWHPWREVVIEGAQHVPETRALMTVEKSRAAQARRSLKKKPRGQAQFGRVRQRNRSDLIRIGSYIHAYDCLYSVARREPERYERQGEKLRLKQKEEP